MWVWEKDPSIVLRFTQDDGKGTKVSRLRVAPLEMTEGVRRESIDTVDALKIPNGPFQLGSKNIAAKKRFVARPLKNIKTATDLNHFLEYGFYPN